MEKKRIIIQEQQKIGVSEVNIMNVMITGHRPERLKGREKEVKEWINNQLNILQPTLAINGMAQGVDQIFAKIAKDKNIVKE